MSPFVATHRHESFALCPPQARTRPSLRATTVGERDGPIARPTIAILDAESILHASHISDFAGLSTPRCPKLVFSRPISLAAAHLIAVCRPRKSPSPSFSASSFFDTGRSYVSPHSAAPPTWHGSVACPLGSFWP